MKTKQFVAFLNGESDEWQIGVLEDAVFRPLTKDECIRIIKDLTAYDLSRRASKPQGETSA